MLKITSSTYVLLLFFQYFFLFYLNIIYDIVTLKIYITTYKIVVGPIIPIAENSNANQINFLTEIDKMVTTYNFQP